MENVQNGKNSKDLAKKTKKLKRENEDLDGNSNKELALLEKNIKSWTKNLLSQKLNSIIDLVIGKEKARGTSNI